MNPLELPLALFAFFAFVAVAPAWFYFVHEYGAGLPAESYYLAQLVFPVAVALFIAGWVQR